MIVQDLVFLRLARRSSVISFCFTGASAFANPRLCSTSGAVREPEGNRAALGLAPSSYTVVPRFLFPGNQRCFRLSRSKRRASERNKSGPRAVTSDEQSCRRGRLKRAGLARVSASLQADLPESRAASDGGPE